MRYKERLENFTNFMRHSRVYHKELILLNIAKVRFQGFDHVFSNSKPTPTPNPFYAAIVSHVGFTSIDKLSRRVVVSPGICIRGLMHFCWKDIIFCWINYSMARFYIQTSDVFPLCWCPDSFVRLWCPDSFARCWCPLPRPPQLRRNILKTEQL